MPDMLARRVSRRDTIRLFVASGLALTGGLAWNHRVSTQAAVLRDAHWRLVAPSAESPAPPGRGDHVLVAADRAGSPVLFLYGGRASAALPDLWLFDLTAGRWRSLSPGRAAPSARWGHNAVFDAPRNRLVVFGGQGSSGFFDDTWAFDLTAETWTRLDTGPGPSPRYGAGSAHDPGGSRLFVSHGFTDAGRFDDTWSLDLSSDRWTNLSPVGPRPLRRCLLRSWWDPALGRLFVYAGQSSPPQLDDLWSFDPVARAWTEDAARERPPARNLYAAVFDERSGSAVVHGGNGVGGTLLGDLWSRARDGVWSSLTISSGPGQRAGHDLTVVPSTGRLYLFGGFAPGSLSDLWELGLSFEVATKQPLRAFLPTIARGAAGAR